MLQINVIREKAAEAEAIVKNITTDVQRLDVAKRNLTSSIQMLERWEMLRRSMPVQINNRPLKDRTSA